MNFLSHSMGKKKPSSRVPYLIVLADDHVLIREGIKRVLEEKTDLKVVGEASDGIEVLALLDKLASHMVILDISMPNLGGIEATHRIKRLHPGVKVLILTMHKSKEYLQHAIAAGADGYLLKEDANTDLFSAIERIRRGEVYVSPHLFEEGADQSAPEA
jgi:DNA-binding NarL/FixJ family response regulator